ncbi:MAG: dihydroneopterin aldolase [Bacteroidetes bacterium CG2_30_33_31]|nr:MAG: dihydroneopterin aldolase [Bacteroidetes bacterium CG2_30_33_31]
MSVIAIEGMEFFSYHGHFEEEKVIGTRFVIDLYIETSTEKAEESDNLKDTINYQEVYLLVKEEMKTPSHLLEHIARRILTAIRKRFAKIESIDIKLHKMNPPLGGQIESVSITLSE